MPLVVRKVEHSDVIQCIGIRTTTLGSLVIGRPPPYPGYFEKQEASLHKDIDHSPHVHHLKVVDTENEAEVLAYAKWEMYEHGRPDLKKLREPMKKEDMDVDDFGLLRKAAHEYFCRRNREAGKKGHLRKSLDSTVQLLGSESTPKLTYVCTVLALIVTAEQHRRRGAGSLLVKWGIEMSEKTSLPCYLQASEQGRRLYLHHGFHELDTVEFDLSRYGLKGVEKMTEMRREHQSKLDIVLSDIGN